MLPCPPERIALIGPRGSGKSCVGAALARQLGWTFLDADSVLEQQAGQSIRTLFATEGEAGFRDRESAILGQLCQLPRHVIATGGGVILRPENRALLRRSAWVVWLTADVETLSRRLSQDDNSAERRPSLTGAASASSPEEITAVLRMREPLYRECASNIINTADRAPEAIAADILRAITSPC
jgi:shikimate kinase